MSGIKDSWVIPSKNRNRRWWDVLDQRQRDEIEFAEIYRYKARQHGTDGHNRLIIIAEMANLLDEMEWMKEQNNK